MKIKVNQLALAFALVSLFGSATASADMGIEQSRTFNSGGGQTTMKMGVSPSEFDPMQIAYKLTMAQGEMAELWAMTPEQPSLASQRAAEQALNNGIDMAIRSIPQFGIGGVGGSFLPTITSWVAWGIQQGFVAPDYYSQVLASCLVRESGNTGEDGMMFRRQACQVQAYIQSYALNPKGYAGGNLMGLVPLCEVQQQNDCNITGGSFNPMARLREEQAARAAKQQEAANNAASRAMVMHNAAYQRYLALKDGKTPPQANDKTPSGVVIGIQPNAPTMAQLNAMTAKAAAEQKAHPSSAAAQAGQNASVSQVKDCNVRHNMGKLTDAQFTQCLNAALAGSIPGVVIPPLPGTPGAPPYAAASGAAK